MSASLTIFGPLFTPRSHYLHKCFAGFCILLACLLPASSFSQCSDWYINATVPQASGCAASGSFTLSIAGPDAANITNLQYGIAIGANGFSVPLNNSPVFSNLPSGIFQTSAVGTCNGNTVGKNKTVTVPGNYIPPQANIAVARKTLTCRNLGIISVNIANGLAPFTFTLTSVPAGYSGPLTFVGGGTGSFTNLPAGNYTVQVTDACGNGTVPLTAAIGYLSAGSASFSSPIGHPRMAGCDSIYLSMPDLQSADWRPYAFDTFLRVSAVIGNGVAAPTPFIPMRAGELKVRLAPGKSIKDCYGQTVVYTILLPCGGTTTVTDEIQYPFVNYNVNQHCNADFDGQFWLEGGACEPVSFSLQRAGGGTYGPFQTLSGVATATNLPLGNYTINYTTADGYSWLSNFDVQPVTGNPYTVRVLDGQDGLHNFISGFEFSTTNAGLGDKHVELFSGPAGYGCNRIWTLTGTYQVIQNQFGGPGTALFPAGNYVWKITDDCGSYLIPVNVGPSDLYQYTVSIRDSLRVCGGKWIYPTGTAINNGVNKPFRFRVLRNRTPYQDPQQSTSWPIYNNNDGVFLDRPGLYTIVPFSGRDLRFLFDGNGFTYPNVYTRSTVFNNSADAVQVDVSRTQGFLCGNGGKIVVAGLGGIPFQTPAPHYNFALANAGSTNFLATNTTGIFTGFGATANAQYDVRVTDSCGAFSTQRVKILDLQTARLISATKYVACLHDSLRLSAVFLPNASYSWTGPNGFSSNDRMPFISDLTATNAGLYRVTITTTECSMTLHDSTQVAINGNPPRPVIGYTCKPLPGTVTILNPVAGYSYLWRIGSDIGYGSYYTVQAPSDTAYSLYVVYDKASYKGVALDTSTGCTSLSDSLFFNSQPVDSLDMRIYSPHLNICTNDTTILVVQESNAASYQWFRNGQPVPGANSQVLATGASGAYKVRVESNICNIDTSDEVTVSVLPPPSATIAASATQLCPGDTAVVQAANNALYTYNWLRNGATIPGQFGAQLRVTAGGNYALIVSNGACARSSNTIGITMLPGPVVSLQPSVPQVLCPGDSIRFSTPYAPDYTYIWKSGNTTIAGASGNTYTAHSPGIYRVIVGNQACPSVQSVTVAVTMVSPGVDLGQDTTICQPGAFAFMRSVDTSFYQVMWSTGATGRQLLIDAPGKYWVRATNSCGTYSDTLVVTTLAQFLPDFPDDTLVCNAANRLILSVPSRLQQIVWSTGDTRNYCTVDSPGTYWVTGMSACGLLTDTVRVHFCAPGVTEIQLPAAGICAGDCFEPNALTARYPTRYSWTFSGGQPDSSTQEHPGLVCYPLAGRYPVKLVVSNAGGRDSMTAYLTVHPKPVPAFRDSSVILTYKNKYQLMPCANALDVAWYKDGVLVCRQCPSIQIDAKNYLARYVCVVSNGDCSDSCTYRVRVIDIPHDVWLPDAFTPNGDGRNDVFRIITDNPNIYAVDLYIYNRWGQQLYISHGRDDGWEGTVNGRPADIGTYNWMLRYKVLGTDEVFFKKGDLQLIR